MKFLLTVLLILFGKILGVTGRLHTVKTDMVITEVKEVS